MCNLPKAGLDPFLRAEPGELSSLSILSMKKKSEKKKKMPWKRNPKKIKTKMRVWTSQKTLFSKKIMKLTNCCDL